MPESLVQVTSGGGPKLHTFQRTIGANNVEDEIVLQGLPYMATYTVAISGISVATAASHVLQIMAGASLVVYVHRITLWQAASATAAAYCEWSLRRLTTAGTGGTAITPAILDAADSASGATAMTLPTVKGTEGPVPWRSNSWMIQTPAVGLPVWAPVFDFRASENGLYKPIRIPVGAANGLAVRNDTGVAGATVTGIAVISEYTI